MERVVLLAGDRQELQPLCQQLTENGYRVEYSHDSESALRQAQLLPPDVVVVDTRLLPGSGAELVEDIHALQGLEQVPVLFLVQEDEVLGLDQSLDEIVRSGDLLSRVSTAAYIKALQDQLRTRRLQLERLAATDWLTGCANRRTADRELQRLLSSARRHNRQVTVAMLDVDYFKRVNDTYGHGAGDAVLRAVVQRVSQRIRDDDLLGRWGGEEFLLLFPDTNPEGAAVVAENLRAVIENTPIEYKEYSISVTVSIGWACWSGENPEQLVSKADHFLYEAKHAGRNRVYGG